MQGYRHLEEFAADYPSDDDIYDDAPTTTSAPAAGRTRGAGGQFTRAAQAAAPPPAAEDGGSRRTGPDRRAADRGAPPVVPPRRRRQEPPPVVAPRHRAEVPPHAGGQWSAPGPPGRFSGDPLAAHPQQASQRGRAQGDGGHARDGGHSATRTDPSGLFAPQQGGGSGHYYDNEDPPGESQPFGYVAGGGEGARRFPPRTKGRQSSRCGGGTSPPTLGPDTRRPPGAEGAPHAQTATQQSHSGALEFPSDRTAVASPDDARTAGDVRGGAFSDDVVFPDDVPSQYQHEDLADLEFLDNDILLEQLQTRFNDQQPYVSEFECSVKVILCLSKKNFTDKIITDDKTGKKHLSQSSPNYVLDVKHQHMICVRYCHLNEMTWEKRFLKLFWNAFL